MHQPVDQGRCQGVVHVKDFAPFPEGSIRGDHDRSHFITGGDNLEQLIGSALVDGQIVQLIEEENEIAIAIVSRISGRSMIVHPSEEKKGGLDDPRHSRQSQLTSHRTPDPNVDVPRFSHSSCESGSLSFMQ